MADNLPSDSSTIVSVANQTYDSVRDGLKQKGVPEFIAVVIAALAWVAMFLLSTLKLALSFGLKDIALPIALEVIKIISDVRASGGKEFADIAAAVMGEFLGVEIDPGNLAPGQGAGAAAQRASALGNAFMNTLQNSMQGAAPIDASDGAANAKRFAGYGINFAVANSLMSIIAELVSDEHLTQLHELGDEVATNLGLGRLMHSALAPFVHAAITNPFTRFMNAQYRGKELSVGELMQGLNAARLAEQDVTRALTELGYSDEFVAELKMQHAPKLTLHDIDALVRWGKIDSATAISMLVAQGIPSAIAQQKLDALHLAEADREELAYAQELLGLAKDRMVDQNTFATLLARLHLSDEQKQGIANRVGLWLDNHHKPLSLGELIFLQERNLITGEEVTAWTEQQGFSPNDSASIDLYITEKSLEFAAAQKAKAAKAAAAAAKKGGSSPPPKA